MDLSETSANNHTLKKEKTLCTARIPTNIKAIVLISETIQSSPWAVSISFPATKGNVNKVKEDSRRKNKPAIKVHL